MADLIITPSLGKIDFIHQSAQAPRFESIILHEEDGLVFTGKISASSVTAPLNVINVTAGSSNVNYPFIFASSGETGAKSLLMDSAGGTYNPSTNTATIDISGNSATTTLASNSTNLGGVGAASYVTLTDTQTLTNKTITGTFTGNLSGTSSWATNATNALTATNATQLNGQAASYYTNIPARLGYTPVDRAGDTVSGNLTVNGNFSVNGSFTAFSASNIYLSSSVLTIEDNILTLNAFSPYLRYAGIEMYDSGSGTLSSLLWDGEGDYFFLTGSTVNGKIITGPDAQSNLTANFVPKATAGNKLGNSLIYDNGTGVGINKTSFRLNCALDVNGSACFGTSAYGFYVGTDATGTFLDAGTQLMRVFTGQQERLRIDTSGNIGIGTTVPVARLQVNSTTSGDTLFRTDGTNGTLFSVVDDLSDSLMSVNNSAGLPVLEVFADDRIVAGQYGQDDLVVRNNYVGIGTNNPTAKLYVTSSTSIASALFLGGNVGIGTTNPVGKLDVRAGSGGEIVFGTYDANYVVKIQSGDQLNFYNGVSPNPGYINYGGGATVLSQNLHVEKATAGVNGLVRIKADGNVGIGTTLPFAKLHVQGNISASSFTSSISNAVGFLGTSSWANNATTVVTNANLTGDVTSVGNVTTIANNAVTTAKILDANVTNAKLTNSSLTIGSTAIALGTTATTIAGLTSVTSTTFVGALTGTATTGSYANNLNAANQYTVGGITGSLFGTSSWATNALTANNVNNATLTIATGSGISLSATPTFTANASVDKTITITNTGVTAITTNTGLSTNASATGAVTITNTGVTAITTNTGLSANASATGAVTITNTGVTSNVAGSGISVSGATGAVTITNSSPNATHTGDVTGATALTIANDAVTTVKILDANVTNAKLANSSITVGSTAISLGGTTTTLPGLTSVTSTTVNATTVNTTNISASATGSFGIVGIGTNSPAYKLDVIGDARVSGGIVNGGLSAQWTLSGGGTTLFNGYIFWSNRIIAIPVEKTEFSNEGYIDINCPTSGTITYYNSSNVTTTVTCDANGIPTSAWESLYYEVTPGQSNVSDQTKFRLVNYQNSTWRPSSNWLLICTRNGDGNFIKWIPGQVIIPIGGSFDSSNSTNNWQIAGTTNYIPKFTAANKIGNSVIYDNSGKIGIGTTSPNSLLDIQLTSASPRYVTLSTNDGQGSYNGYGLNFRIADQAHDIAQIRGVYETSAGGGSGGLAFATRNAGGLTSSVFIQYDGNVGIGTNSPTSLLELSSSTARNLFNIKGAGTWGSSILFVSSSGRIGLGTNNPTYGLVIQNYTTTQTGQVFVNAQLNSSGKGLVIDSNTRTTLDNSVLALEIINNAGTNTLAATVAGNVGIGTTSPSALLNIRASAPTGTGTVTTGTNLLIDSSTNNYITFRNTADNGTYAGLVFLDNNIGGYIAFGNAGAAVGSDSMIYGAYQDHIFQNGYVNENLYNRTETMRIKQNGNVGIGTTVPGQKLDVEGRIRTRGATGTGGFEIGAATTGAAKWRIEWDSASDSLDFNWVG